MSRTSGGSDDDQAIPVALESAGLTGSLLLDAADSSPEADDALWARDAAAAADAGDGRRADALVCARALLAERRGDEPGAFVLWRAAFDRDPTLSIAFWGLRRALRRREAWEELARAIDLRIAAVLSPAGAQARADLWLEQGRLWEDRLHRDDAAAQSYRGGLMEVGDHPALLTSLLLLGFRRGDKEMTAEALAGLLRRPMSPALRASTTARLSRLERGSSGPASQGGPAGPAGPAAEAAQGMPAPRALDAASAARALASLRAALRAVGPAEAGPLLAELSSLARVTTDPATRVELLEEMVSHGATGGTGATGEPDGAVPLLREQARLLRDTLSDRAAAATALRAALARAPGHPLVVAELADLVESAAEISDGGGDATGGLRDLLAVIAPGDRGWQTEAEKEVGLRYLTALARAGRTDDALAALHGHAELPRDRADVFALEVLLRAGTHDTAGLAACFERMGERWAMAVAAGSETAAASPLLAAHALVVAGTLCERSAATAPGPAAPATSEDGDADTDASRLYRRALEVQPGYGPALAAIERRLWAAERWRDLADLLSQRLAHPRPADFNDGVPEGGPDRVERVRLLEDLVAVHRDLLDDPVSARRYQDERLTLGGADARAWVRRQDLEWSAAARGAPSSAEVRVRILRALAEHAGAPAAAAALRVDAARAAGEGGDLDAAETLLREASVADAGGLAAAGLERLVNGPDPVANARRRAELVRAEIARLSGASGESGAAPARVRALRFRVASHEAAGGRAAEALAALEPLRSSGDVLAAAWSWEIARRSGDATLEVAILRSPPLSG
ncbi:MAG: hypothetical protein ABUR63_07620, partial [Verrucomicrobiota bacterium]